MLIRAESRGDVCGGGGGGGGGALEGNPNAGHRIQE